MSVETVPIAATVVDLPIAEAREVFVEWIASRRSELDEIWGAFDGSLEGTFAGQARLQRLLYEEGWVRLGWAPELGGLGGPLALRGLVIEELANHDYPTPFSFATQEVLGPAVAKFAAPDLAAALIPRLLTGEETWCQGFSEPAAGSDLASLQVRAVPDGDDWRVTGEKVWTSWAQFAARGILLARTGAPDSGSRGITAFILDMDTPGIELRPLVTMNGDEEFCSVFYDDVRIPGSRVLGEVGGGWAVAMHVLSGERGTAAWQRGSWQRYRLRQLVASTPEVPDAVVGEAYELTHALRLLSRRTLRTLSAAEPLGPESSFDKLLMSTADRFLFDAAFAHRTQDLLFGTDPDSRDWRTDYMYSRASSIYGGAAEIQRNIIAERILGLPRG